jgi:phospholipid transport system substrate-binding protein
MHPVSAARYIVAGLFFAASVAAAAIDDPQQLIRTTAESVLAEVSDRKAELEADPRLIYPLVENSVLPHFDFRRMSQSALGRFWRDATEPQKEDVTREFREMLVRTYATALLGYTGQAIEYLPAKFGSDATKVVVPTRLVLGGGPPVPVDYRLRKDADGWKIYDVVIDNVSLITNYRSQFASVVRRSGIDGLITALANKNREPTGD